MIWLMIQPLALSPAQLTISSILNLFHSSPHSDSSACVPRFDIAVEPAPKAVPVELLTLLVDPPCLNDSLVDAVVLAGCLLGRPAKGWKRGIPNLRGIWNESLT